MHAPQFPFVRLHRRLEGRAELLAQGVDGLRPLFLRPATRVGDGGVVLDFVVGLAVGAADDFGGGLEGGEEAEAAGVGFLLLLLLFVVFVVIALVLFRFWSIVAFGRCIDVVRF